jgi:acetylornithine deacetylase/succinyl-diaminopimelate desuccinylase-like protein
LNCRLLPGTDVGQFASLLRGAVDDPRVEVVPERPPSAIPDASPEDGPLYTAIRTVVSRMAPGVPVVPYMSPGGTDSQVLRQRGIAAYGLLPFPIEEGDLRTMHGDDERISLDAFDWGNELLVRIVLEAAR